jgi:hypothetical protein
VDASVPARSAAGGRVVSLPAETLFARLPDRAGDQARYFAVAKSCATVGAAPASAAAGVASPLSTELIIGWN